MTFDPAFASIRETSQALRSQQISPHELAEDFLARIAASQPHLNAFISIADSEEGARTDAAQAEQALQSSDSLLCGIPIAHKDIFNTKNMRTTCASRMLEDFTPPFDATVVTRLAGAGTVMLGKTNMDEFAMGTSNETSWFGPVANPWDTSRSPGGSSGGSAAAVAGGLATFATGTDTGGSIRQPAALCGVVGFKPTYGRISRYGVVAFASSLDQPGVLARSVEDTAIAFVTMGGFDQNDPTSSRQPMPGLQDCTTNETKGLRVGIVKEHLASSPAPAVQKCLEEAIQEFQQAGASITEISLPHIDYSVPCYYVIAPAEASSNLARYDGVRYGHRSADPQAQNSIEDLMTLSRSEGFGAEVQRRLLTGAFVLSEGFMDAYYTQACRVRTLITQDFTSAFDNVDVLLTYSAPDVAFKTGSLASDTDPTALYNLDIYTIGANLAGLPCISVPAGFHDGLPIGLQLIGNAWQDATVLSAAQAFETIVDIPRDRRPQWGSQHAV